MTCVDQVHGATVSELVNLADPHRQVADVCECRSFTGIDPVSGGGNYFTSSTRGTMKAAYLLTFSPCDYVR